MRPLLHPSVDDVSVEGILHALSDPIRFRIFADIARAANPQTCSACGAMIEAGVPKSTLSQHFKVLRESGLIRSERQGVEMLNTSRQDEIDRRFPGLVDAVLEAHDTQSKLRRRARRSRHTGR